MKFPYLNSLKDFNSNQRKTQVEINCRQLGHSDDESNLVGNIDMFSFDFLDSPDDQYNLCIITDTIERLRSKIERCETQLRELKSELKKAIQTEQDMRLQLMLEDSKIPEEKLLDEIAVCQNEARMIQEEKNVQSMNAQYEYAQYEYAQYEYVQDENIQSMDAQYEYAQYENAQYDNIQSMDAQYEYAQDEYVQDENIQSMDARYENVQSRNVQSRKVQSRKVQSKTLISYDDHKSKFFNLQSVCDAYREILSLTKIYQIMFPPLEFLIKAWRRLTDEQSINDFVTQLELRFLQLNGLTKADEVKLCKFAYLIHQLYLISLDTPITQKNGLKEMQITRRAELKKQLEKQLKKQLENPENYSRIISKIRNYYSEFDPTRNTNRLPTHFSNGIIGNVFMSLFLCHFHAKAVNKDWRKILVCPTCGLIPNSKVDSRNCTTLSKHYSRCPSLRLPPV